MVFKSLKKKIELSTKDGEMSSLPFIVEKGLNWYIRWFQYSVEDENVLRIKSIQTMDMLTGSRTYKAVTGLCFILDNKDMFPDYNNPKNEKYYKDLEIAFGLHNKNMFRSMLKKETDVQSIHLYDLMRDWK